MSQIRRQSIISTLFVYAGFVIGFVNTFLFTRSGSPFDTSEYGLTSIFIAVGNLMFAFANMGMISVVYKFYPYYNDNLPKKKNDLITWSMVTSLIGFCFVIIAGIIFKDLVVRKFGANSPLFIQYYFWVFPFGLSLLLFSLFEVYAWNIRKSVFTTFLRELLFRLLTTMLIFLLSFHFIKNFDTFIKLYAFGYGVVAFVLLIYLVKEKEFYITFTISRVTRKFYKKIVALASLVYVGGTVLMIAQFIDTIVIMSLLGTAAAGIFALGSVVAGLVQAPQRGAIAASIPPLSKAWKDKDYEKINLIYQRSGINLLIASLGIFLIVWLNYIDAVNTFGLKPAYLQSQWIFFYLGMARIIDLGTGVNAQIIGTSIYWRFDLISGIILFLIITPLSYILVKHFGIVGAGYSNVISFTIYNILRIIFLHRKFKMHPFGITTIPSILVAAACFFITYYIFRHMHGFFTMVARSILFITLYGGAILLWNLTPDAKPVLHSLTNRIFKRGENQ
jgi:O-antigen/teichoic acid export membrane protein